MTPFIYAVIHDARRRQSNLEFMRIDSAAEVNKDGLRARLEHEHIKQLMLNSCGEFLNDFLPGGKANVRFTFHSPPQQWNQKETQVYLWRGYVICTSSECCGQWVNVTEGVYGNNLLDLYIYRTKSHPRDAHKYVARKYGWDISSESILFQSPKAGFRQPPTIPDEFDFAQHVKFIEETGCSVYKVFKYRNRTGATRGAMVYCQSPDKEQLVAIPVVQVEHVYSNDSEVTYPGWTKVPAENCIDPNLRCQVHGYSPYVVSRVEICFFQAPYPLFNEFGLERNKEDIVIISEDELWAGRLTSFFEKNNRSGYLSVSWPGGKKAAKDVDWMPLEGRKVEYAIHKDDRESCSLAYSVYRSTKHIVSGEFRFHVYVKGSDVQDSIETVESFASDYNSLSPNDFVKYVWERHGISLRGDIQPTEPLQALTVEEFINQDIAPPNFILDPILPSPGLAEAFAPRGLGKTFFAMELAKAIATGGTAFGRWKSPLSRNVLYIDGEMSLQQMSKRAKLLNLREADGRLKIMSASGQTRPIKDLSTPDGQADIERYLKEHQTEVIIIDNIATLAPKALGNDVECCIPLMTWVNGLKHQGYSVILIHHAGKSNGGRGGNQRGSSVKEDTLDAVISLEVPNQKKNQAHFNVLATKARDTYGEVLEPFSLLLTTSKDGESAQWEVGEYLSGKKAAEAKSKVEARPKISPEERQSLATEIERLYQETTDNEDIIAEKVGLKNRSGLNRFLGTLGQDEKKRIKSIRASSRSKAVKAPIQASVISESIPTFPN